MQVAYEKVIIDVTTNFLSLILIEELVSAGAIQHMVGINAIMFDVPEFYQV
jgi:hypothetical protein